MKFYVSSEGDRSVGVKGGWAEIDTNGVDGPQMVSEAKRLFAEAFSALWDEHATVITEEELRAQAAAEEAADTELDVLQANDELARALDDAD